jgi:hypothetical protein
MQQTDEMCQILTNAVQQLHAGDSAARRMGDGGGYGDPLAGGQRRYLSPITATAEISSIMPTAGRL